MKRLSFIFIVYTFSFQVHAPLKVPDGFDKQQSESSTEKKVDYSLNVGTTFFSSPGYASGSAFYLTPEFKLKLSPKFRVDAGIMLMQNRFSYSAPTSLFGEQSVVVKSAPAYGGVAYASGNYALNPRLTFSGSIVKSFTPGGNSNQDAGFRNSFQMMSVGADYKISEHLSVGAGVRFVQSNGFNPYTGYNYLSPGLGFSPMNSYVDPFR